MFGNRKFSYLSYPLCTINRQDQTFDHSLNRSRSRSSFARSRSRSVHEKHINNTKDSDSSNSSNSSHSSNSSNSYDLVEELYNAYNKLYDYYDSLSPEARNYLSVSYKSYKSGRDKFKDKMPPLSINLYRDLYILKPYHSGYNSGIIFCNMFDEKQLQSLDYSTITPSHLQIFIMKHAKDYRKLIHQDLLKLFKVETKEYLRYLELNKLTRLTLGHLLSFKIDIEDITNTFNRLEKSQDELARKLPRIASLVGGRYVSADELIRFTFEEKIDILELVDKCDILKHLQNIQTRCFRR